MSKNNNSKHMSCSNTNPNHPSPVESMGHVTSWGQDGGDNRDADIIFMKGKISVSNSHRDNASVYFTPSARILMIKDGNMSSVNAKHTSHVVGYDNNRWMMAHTDAAVSYSNGDQKIFHIDSVKSVKKDGENALKMQISAGEFSATGTYANKVKNLSELYDHDIVDMYILRRRIGR